MNDVRETLSVIEKIIADKLSPDTDSPHENWPRFLALLRIQHVAENAAAKYAHASDEMSNQ